MAKRKKVLKKGSRAGLKRNGKLKKGCKFLKGGRISCYLKGARRRKRR